MKKSFLLTILFLVLIMGCSDPVEKLIPPEALKGALTNLNITGKTQTGKSVKGGTLIEVFAMVPYDIKRKQLKPTLLGGIKGVKKQNSDCEWIILWLRPGKSKGAGIYAGRAEYKEGKIDLYYGIPSKKQLAQSLELKNKYSDPALKGKKDEAGFDQYDPDYEAVRLLNKQDFDLGVHIRTLYYKYYKITIDKDEKTARKNKKWNSDLYRQLSATFEERVLRLVADELKLPVVEIRKMKSKILRYYDHMAWGSEIIQ